MGGDALPGLETRPLDFEYATVRFDLTLLMSEAADGLNASWTYSTDLFDDATVARLHERFETLLAGVSPRAPTCAWIRWRSPVPASGMGKPSASVSATRRNAAS